jgi:type I restriction enzyme S subunit
MNAERLIAHYERIADAPDAIARLRRFILDLAVRGKLVPQDPNDKPASELRECLGTGPGQARRKVRGSVTEDGGDIPAYELPRTWRWVRIGDHLELVNGAAFKPTDWLPSGLKIVRIQNLNRHDAPFNYCDPKRIRDRFLIDDGSFLISWSGTPGTSFGAFIWGRGPAALNQHIYRCDFLIKAFNPDYLRLAINGRLDEMIAMAHGGVGLQHITKGKLEALLIALPPHGEQPRVVAKVNELMALCDRLETARAEREEMRDRLASASLARLNAPNPETFHDDVSFALDMLPALTTRPDQINQLRQTILNLAVRGKLVPQDCKDEPASTLLERIVAVTGRRQRSDVVDEEEAAPYSLPVSWKWTALNQVIASGPQNGISPRPTSRKDAPKAITLTATTSGVFNQNYFKRVEAKIPEDSDFWLQEGDLLFQRGNTREYVGIAAVYEGPAKTFLFPDLIMKVRISPLTNLRFIHLAAISPPSRTYFSLSASGAQATMPKINQNTLVNLPIPLPPLAEQGRIVAKVDELMALCDRLEASLSYTDETRRYLLDALLAEALTPHNDAAAAEASRIVAQV